MLSKPTKAYGSHMEGTWCVQQKIDGERLLLEVQENGTVKAYNRNGDPKPIPDFLRNVRVYTPTVFDGELLDGKYYVFDLALPKVKFQERIKLAKLAVETANDTNIVLVPTYTDNIPNRIEMLKALGAEGVIFRKLSAVYRSGKSSALLKYKFTRDADCVIMSRPKEAEADKQNFYLGMYRDGSLVEVGKCSALTGDGPKAKIGDVVKVSCLYATDSGKLYQPVTPRLRTDKKPEECTIDQLETLTTNKKVKL